MVRTEPDVHIKNSGRKHNPLMYKSFTFDSLTEQLFNDKEKKKTRKFYDENHSEEL